MDLLDNNTPQQGRVRITNPLAMLLIGGIGTLTEVLDDLQKPDAHGAGIGLARAVVEKHLADARARSASRMLREAAKAGADLSTVDVETTVGPGSEVWLSWEVKEAT